jgi:hypothetical protein
MPTSPEKKSSMTAKTLADGSLILLRTALAFALLILTALLTQPMALADNSNPRLKGGPGHPLPRRPPGRPFAPTPTGAHLTYYGGRVCSNMQVVQVLYGTGNYLPNVTSTASPSIATFYQGVLNSPYLDWLSEYNTSITASGGSPGTNQSIGRGGFVGQFTITPSMANSGTTIDDTQIQNELAAQITAGNLPAPTTDVAGNNNTYYAVFFPHGVSITSGGAGSCVAGGFCAYHGTIASVNGHEIYYGVHPDMQAGSGCDTGCGAGTAFQNYTSVASHEMTETITDGEVGLATATAAPLAWYDSTNGEIGDICNAQQGSVVGGDGVTYTVQKEWSNAATSCIVAGQSQSWSGYTQLGSNPIAGPPSAVSWGPNRIDVFVQGTDRALYTKSWNGSVWSGYTQLGSNPIAGPPSAVSWGPNRIDIFVQGTDGALYTKSWN